MIKGKAILGFGRGDILVSPVCINQKTRAIVFQNKGTHTVGEYTSGEEFKQENDDTVFVFENVESLNVVIERLEFLKNMMNGELEGYTETEYELEVSDE